MDAPKSKKFRELRRKNGAVANEAVRQSLTSRRKGLLERIFSFRGKTYRVTAVREENLTSAVVPAEKK